jgi:hypothetical protein
MSLPQAHLCHISKNMSDALNRSGRRVSAITSHSILDRVVIQASSAASNAASAVGDTANIPHLTYLRDRRLNHGSAAARAHRLRVGLWH